MTTQFQHIWDQEAATFDNEPDHGLRDPIVRQAWSDLFAGWLSSSPVNILDIGCGTGSLSLLLASLGHNVTGLDFSPEMLAQAKTKNKAAFVVCRFASLLVRPSACHDILRCCCH